MGATFSATPVMAECDYGDPMVVLLHYNYTGKFESRTPGHKLKAVDVLLLLVCFFIVLANLSVLLAISCTSRLHTPVYASLGNLALCDLLAGFAFCTNVFYSGRKTFDLSPALWFLREGSVLVTLSASVFGLLTTAIERHLTMLRLRPRRARVRPSHMLLLGVCWIAALLLGFLPMLGWNCICRLPSCSAILPLYSRSYLVFCGSLLSLTLLAIAVLYARIYSLVDRSNKRVSNLGSTRKVNGNPKTKVAATSDGPRRPKPSRHSLQLLKTVMVVLCVFIMCWAPLCTLFMIDAVCAKDRCGVDLHNSKWFMLPALLHSGLNPMIYTLASRELREALCRLLCSCLSSARSTHRDISRSSDSLDNTGSAAMARSASRASPQAPRDPGSGESRAKVHLEHLSNNRSLVPNTRLCSPLV
uniref:sphingosine 1-phosphate receptor 3-like n=1 Tax=Myxine glutinosa TaxID=7769 RepID=UPI00358E87FF